MKIRKPKRKDWKLIVELLNSEETLKNIKDIIYKKGDALQFLKDSEKTLILEKDKKIIGLVSGTFFKQAGILMIHFLVIKKENRKKGLAKLLLKEITELVKGEINRIILYSGINNKPMTKLMKGLKYKKGEEMFVFYKFVR